MAKGKLLKLLVPKKALKLFNELMTDAYFNGRSAAATAMGANQQRNVLKMVANTFSRSRKNFSVLAKTNLSPELFNMGLEQRIGKGAAALTMKNLKLVQAGRISELTKMRRQSGKKAAKGFDSIRRITGARSVPDRVVNARAQGIRFIRRNGRIIPIRPKK